MRWSSLFHTYKWANPSEQQSTCMPWDSWGDLQLSSHPTAFIPNYRPLPQRCISCLFSSDTLTQDWPWLCFDLRESNWLAGGFFRGFAANFGFGWLVWVLNYLRSSSQACIRTSELYSHVLLLQVAGEDITGKGSVSWECWTAFLQASFFLML